MSTSAPKVGRTVGQDGESGFYLFSVPVFCFRYLRVVSEHGDGCLAGCSSVVTVLRLSRFSCYKPAAGRHAVRGPAGVRVAEDGRGSTAAGRSPGKIHVPLFITTAASVWRQSPTGVSGRGFSRSYF